MPDKNGTEIIGFHGKNDPYWEFSNWYISHFDSASVHYNCAEQYMMAQKVLLAGEYGLRDEIMATPFPEEMQKYAGSACFTTYAKVKQVWEKHRGHIVKRGVRAKFAQDPALSAKLLGTGNAILCECAGSDTVWGIGIRIGSGDWKDVSKWRGENLLGRILMELRSEFRTEQALFGSIQNADYTGAAPISVWKMRAEELKRIPQFHTAVGVYSDTLDALQKIAFEKTGLDVCEEMMRTNTGGGLPATGFFEMKQEIYEIAKRTGY